jgi:hypothetical protein
MGCTTLGEHWGRSTDDLLVDAAGEAVILVRAEDAHRYTEHPMYVKGLAFVAGPGAGLLDPDYDSSAGCSCAARLPRSAPSPASPPGGSWP